MLKPSNEVACIQPKQRCEEIRVISAKGTVIYGRLRPYLNKVSMPVFQRSSVR